MTDTTPTPTARAYTRGFSDGEEWSIRQGRLEAEFWNDAEKWIKEGSGMTREQETGAAMLWSWLSSRIGRNEAAR